MKRLLVLLFLLPTLAHAQGAGSPPYRGVNNWPLIFGTDNTYDIGAAGAQRPRTLYAGTSVVTPALTVSGLTSGRVPVASTGGALTDFSTLAFSGGTLTATNLTATSGVTAASVTDSGLTSGRVPIAGSGGLLGDDADLTFATDTLSATKISVPAGASNATSINFGTAGTGIYSATAATMVSFAAGGSEYLRVQANDVQVFGNVLRVQVGLIMTAQALTTGTMAVENTARVRDTLSSYTWSNAQVTALGATTSGDITVATLPAKTQVLDVIVVITGAAAGPTTVTVSCGRTSASYIDYIVASDAKAAANTVYGDTSAERGTNLTGYDLPSYTGTTALVCHFVSTGANLSTVTGSTGRVIVRTALLP